MQKIFVVFIVMLHAEIFGADRYWKASEEAWKQIHDRCAQAQFAAAQASRQQVSHQVVQQITDPCVRAQADIHNTQISIAQQQKKQ